MSRKGVKGIINQVVETRSGPRGRWEDRVRMDKRTMKVDDWKDNSKTGRNRDKLLVGDKT